MTKLELTKTVASFVIGAGTSKIVHSIIQNNTDPENAAETVAISGASVVIGMMAAEKTKNYTDTMIDQAAAWYHANVKK